MNTLLLALAVVLGGFSFGQKDAPTGEEWQSPQELSFNKALPHAWFFSFTDVESARMILPENSSLWQSLDGDWKFNWVPVPDERPADFYRTDFDDSAWDLIPVPSNWNTYGVQKDVSQKYGTPIYTNIPYPFHYKRVVGDWKGGIMREPDSTWTMYKCRNEVGSYRRTFTIPADWKGNDVFINFDGVDSFFYLWINGSYVGFSKNSRNVAQFDITNYLVEGENLVAVEVYRNSDGSYLEDQDMFRLAGIFRTVALESKPKMRVRDIRVTPTMKSLNVVATIEGGEGTIDYKLFENKLYSPDNELVSEYAAMPATCDLELADAKPWSAEAPHLYVLVGELKDASGKVVDIFSTNVGFREVAIKSTPASEDPSGFPGRYFYLNGKTFKMRGVNRHETEPAMGHAITRDVMFQDVVLMKRANINHVRDSHYPDDPYWYYLCDMYGIYLMDEANNESHGYGYGEPSLTHVPEFRDAYVGRMVEMICQNYNHPSILVWSSGNEDGPGLNFKAVYDAGKALDPMRPVQYERNNDYSDFGCCQYPSVESTQEIASGDPQFGYKYPYHINEFAHSMGNALGNFVDYWKVIDANDFITGACIWDWVDQSLWNWTEDGIRYLASGGDFGDKPNDGQFVMNGILFGDRSPKPQYFEVKKVYQNLYTTLTADSKLELFNRNYFEPVEYAATWTIIADGKQIAKGTFDTGLLDPRGTKVMDLPSVTLPEGKECFINLSYAIKEDMPWAEAGYETCSDQLLIQAGLPQEAAPSKGRALKCSVTSDGKTLIKGRGFKVTFDMEKGTIHSLKYRGRDVICPGEGPVLNLFRACINNDAWVFWSWFDNGIDNLEHSAVSSQTCETEDGGYVLSFDVVSKAPCATWTESYLHFNQYEISRDSTYTDVAQFKTHVEWTVGKDGSVKLASHLECNKQDFVPARIGYLMKVPAALGTFRYYGRGPGENYGDRCTASLVGVYESTVAEQVTDYTKPQEMGNHEGVRWASLSRGRRGFEVVPVQNSWKTGESGQNVMSMSAIPYSAIDMFLANHTYKLPEAGDTYLCIDAAQLGIGGSSCGPGPMEKDIFHPQGDFSFVIKPLTRR